MKLTIISVDGAIYKDGVSYAGLDLSIVPADVHALQWDGTAGWVEFTSPIPNEEITALPTWAVTAITKWGEAEAARLAAEEAAARLAAEQAAQQTE
jgi:hypothetical protein